MICCCLVIILFHPNSKLGSFTCIPPPLVFGGGVEYTLALASMRLMYSFSQDIGAGKGKYYAVNYPLRDGIDDESYEAIFKPVSH